MPNGVWLFVGWVCVLQVECSYFSKSQGQSSLALVCFVGSEWTYVTQSLSRIFITQITHCRSEVGNTPFTGLVMIYKPLRKPIKIFIAVLNSKELLLLIYSMTRTRQFPPLHCKCINSESHTQEKLYWNRHTCKAKEKMPNAGTLGCKISGEANNSLELLKENEKVGLWPTIKDFLFFSPHRGALVEVAWPVKPPNSWAFHSLWWRMDTLGNKVAQI